MKALSVVRESGLLGWLFHPQGAEPRMSAKEGRTGRDTHRCGTLSLLDGHNKEVLFPVTVESVDVLRVRRSIFEAAGNSVGILKATPVPHDSRVRLEILVRATAVQTIMSAILKCVGTAEFGRLARP